MKKILQFFIVLMALNANAQIVITEIMYNPPEAGTDSTEFVELYNNGSSTVDLTGYSINPTSTTYTFTSGTIKPTEYFVITVNSRALNNTYGVGTAQQQWTNGGMSNTGKAILLLDASKNTVDSVFYSNQSPWPIEAGGNGASLRLCDPNSDNSLASNWTASDESTGIIVNSVTIKATPGKGSNCKLLSSDELITSNKLQLLQNPTLEYIKFSGLSKKENYCIYTITGSKIASGIISNDENISTENFKNGVYLFIFESGSALKFIK